jgi:glycosyltransferase involved in cell wall biosynthesis
MSRLRLYRIVAGWSRDRHVDIVDAPDWEGWIAGWPRLPVPVVLRLNGSATYFAAELGEAASAVTAFLERASFRRADFWCAASRYVAERTLALRRSPTPPPAILYNPVDLVPLSSVPARLPQRIVFAGTLTAKKGVVSLLRAWNIIAPRLPAAELHLYGRDGLAEGGGSMREFLRSILADPFDPRVYFHGHVDRETLVRAFQQARVAVFPSYAEAFAFAPMEAMASGCPTIFSRRGSGPELIEHGRDGLLVDPEDSEGIAREILRVVDDSNLGERLGNAGRRRVERSFSVDLLAPLNEAFYRDCATAFRKRGSSDS